jgi:hypothetical protein
MSSPKVGPTGPEQPKTAVGPTGPEQPKVAPKGPQESLVAKAGVGPTGPEQPLTDDVENA